MIFVLEDPAATHGNEARIPDLGEDHRTRVEASAGTPHPQGQEIGPSGAAEGAN
jgi:hypothetical protein